jgi:PAS domain S-box-containing protein
LSLGCAGGTILRLPDGAIRRDACVLRWAVPAEYDRRVVATDSRPELDSILGTVPGLVFRSRIAPEPYLIEFVSDEMSSIAGYPAKDFMGTEPRLVWTDLMHPDDRERVATTIRGAPADGPITEVEYRALRADGSYAWILSRLRKLVADDGSIWVHGAALDVTARHEAEDLRRELDAEHARTEALEESRLRIVEAGDAARRRLERDLHDGAQQRLIVSLMTLRRAAAKAEGTPTAPLVEEAIEHLSEGLAELRELARGIHPSHLAEEGLGHAIGLLAERAPLPVAVDVPATRLPQSVETALYFTVAEALTNVAKHANAARATVTISIANRCATAEIGDDGRGGATTVGGSGLRGLADRLEAIGGAIAVESPPGGGTVVRASIPLAEGAAITAP